MGHVHRQSESTRPALLTSLSYHDEQGNGARPAIATLARDTGMTERTVQRWLKVLTGRNLIVIESMFSIADGGRQTTNRYRLNYPFGQGKIN